MVLRTIPVILHFTDLNRRPSSGAVTNMSMYSLLPTATNRIRQDAPRAVRAFSAVENVGVELCAPHLRAAWRGSAAELTDVETHTLHS